MYLEKSISIGKEKLFDRNKMEMKSLDKATSPPHKSLTRREQKKLQSVKAKKKRSESADQCYIPDKPGTRSVAIQDDCMFQEEFLLQERMNMYLSHERRISDAQIVMQCFRQIYPEGEKRHKRCPPA